jgi:hypothetical protein
MGRVGLLAGLTMIVVAGSELSAQRAAERVRGEPGAMSVRASECRTQPMADVRGRIVDLALQEWTFFGSRVTDPSEVEDEPPLFFGIAQPGGQRPRLSPAESARVASSIAGYWAVTPEGSWIVERQNGRWNGEGIAARWNAPWSAAFISWVMCEAGLASTTQFRRAIAHHSYIDQAIRARDGSAPGAAFAAYDAGEAPITPGDLLCSSRRPVYRTLADRRRQMGVGARSHCDVVVRIDAAAGRIHAVGGNVRGVVSLKRLPSVRTPAGGLRVEVFDQDRPVFAHLKLRTSS